MSIVVDVIAEYLRTNRRVVVPGFGAFVVKESGECIFSDLLRTDDGILSSLLHQRGLTEMEAAVTIDRFIFEVRYGLEQYGCYRLGEVGMLRVEPTTKSLRLYPPVSGEMPKQVPYVPKPVVYEEEVVVPKAKPVVVADAPKAVNKSVKPRKKLDLVMVIAVLIVLAALAAIGYGWYVSNLAEVDDAVIDTMRVVPEQSE